LPPVTALPSALAVLAMPPLTEEAECEAVLPRPPVTALESPLATFPKPNRAEYGPLAVLFLPPTIAP
jgi:hypothetical protein